MARLDPSAGGAYADFAVVPAEQLVAAPTSIPLFLASGAVTAAATAWQALTEVADVQAGHRVLIRGGAGGVGSFAVQMARKLNAHVITTASGAGVDIARDLGADRPSHRLHRRAAAVPDHRCRHRDRHRRRRRGGTIAGHLRPGGLLDAVPMPPDTQRASARALRAEFLFHSSDAQRLRTIVQMLDDDIRILLDREVDLQQAPQALEYLAAGHAKGKIILTTQTPV